jgi:hypothetical protein
MMKPNYGDLLIDANAKQTESANLRRNLTTKEVWHMTYTEFKRSVARIARQEFLSSQFNPLQYGIERTIFEERKLRQLIALAKRTQFLTAQRKVAGWERKLQRMQQKRERFEQTSRAAAVVRA